MTDKLEALKAAALAATPGPWFSMEDDWRDGEDSLITCELREGMTAIAKIDGGGSESGYDDPFKSEQQANAAFIAAASPDVVLSLLAALERSTKNERALGGLLDEMTRRRDSQANRANAAEQREEHLKATVDVLSAKNAELQQRLQQPIKLPKSGIGMACKFVGDHIVVSLAAVLVETAMAGFRAEVEGE